MQDRALGQAVRRRQGKLLGNENGRTLLALADGIMTIQTIPNPEHMTELFVPGFQVPSRIGVSVCFVIFRFGSELDGLVDLCERKVDADLG